MMQVYAFPWAPSSPTQVCLPTFLHEAALCTTWTPCSPFKALICLLFRHLIIPLGSDSSSQAVFLHRLPPHPIQALTSSGTTAALPRCTTHLPCFVPPNSFRTNLFMKDGKTQEERERREGKGRTLCPLPPGS